MANELTINGTVYSFVFGFGFMREINRSVQVPVQGVSGMKKDAGLKYCVAGLLDGDPEDLIRVLDVANKGQDPRIQRKDLEAFIEDENTDIDGLFNTVIDFLGSANCCKRVVLDIQEALEKQKAKNA